MQTITYPQKHIHPIFDDFDMLYAQTSSKTKRKGLVGNVYDNSFEPLFELFINNGYNGGFLHKDKHYTKIKLSRQNNNIIVCFSGGKDSIATVKHYMDLGYNVYLYHLRHINFALTDEYIQAQELADYWKLPLYIDDIKLSGHHDYVEHPMKNMIIANGALQYGIREGIGTEIAFGNYITSTLVDDNFEYCGGDCMEMWYVYEDIIQTLIPNFRINIVLENLDETLEIVCPDKELLDMSVSCIGRTNLRKHKHDWVKDKYGITLPTNRCGQCYKCCIEYIYMADHDIQEYNEDYYSYCMQKLKQNYETEDNTIYSMQDVWNHYFLYDMSESKLFGK